MNQSVHNLNLDGDWTNHPAIEWLSKHKHILLWSFFCLVAVLVFAARYVTWQTQNNEKDFFKSEAVFSDFQKDRDESSLDQLEEIMNRHPELKAKYEGSLAQILLTIGNPAQSESFFNDIVSRTKSDHLKSYHLYSEGSFLIANGNYGAALESAKQLEKVIDQEKQPLLAIFNTIRLGMLYQELGRSDEELAIWEQLQKGSFKQEAILTANQIFKIGNANLDQYIEERKKAL